MLTTRACGCPGDRRNIALAAGRCMPATNGELAAAAVTFMKRRREMAEADSKWVRGSFTYHSRVVA